MDAGCVCLPAPLKAVDVCSAMTGNEATEFSSAAAAAAAEAAAAA